ncbi:MAG: hotdog fold thioesterase [Acidimicrobiales bacterium]
MTRAGTSRTLPHIPARAMAGVEQIEAGVGRSVDGMHVPEVLLDQDGVLATGALAILADTALGTAVVSTLPDEMGMVTSHLHLELLRPVPPGTITLRATGEQRGIQGRFGIGGGDITTADGVPLALATIGAVLLPRRRSAGQPLDPHPAVSIAGRRHRLIADAPVHDLLGTRVRRADPGGARLLIPAARRLANSAGGVHGGVGVLLGERALDVALRAAVDDERSLRPVELRAAFLRPIAADGGLIECRATVMHLGRRLAAVRGEVRDHEGRPAVLVDATYVGP